MKYPPYQDLPVCLHCNGIDIAICIGVKACIEASIRVKPGDVVSRHPANGGEITPYQDLPVCLHCDGIDLTICIGVKACIEGTIRVEPGDAVSRYPANGGEISPLSGSSRLPALRWNRHCHLHWELKPVSRVPSGLSRAM